MKQVQFNLHSTKTSFSLVDLDTTNNKMELHLVKYILLSLLSLFLVSCAEKPTPKSVAIHTIENSAFLSQMITDYSLNQEDLKNIQFYTSHDIILYKQDSVNNISISKGTLLVNKLSNSKEIVIKAMTPCLFIRGNNKEITVEFDNNVILNFVKQSCKCNLSDKKYYFGAQKWIDNIGIVKVNGVLYKALGTSGQAYLTFDKKSLKNSTSESLTLKGKRIP